MAKIPVVPMGGGVEIVTGSFVTTTQLTTVELGFKPLCVIIYGSDNNGRVTSGEVTAAQTRQIPKVLTSEYADSSFGEILPNGFSHWAAQGGQGITFYFIAFK